MSDLNKQHSSVKQALLDLASACDLKGFSHEAVLCREILSSVSDDVLSTADKVFSRHVYPDTALQWVKLPVSGESSSVLEDLSPDAFHFYYLIVRRLSCFSPLVAFKVSDICSLSGWSVSKTKRLLSELKKKFVLCVVDTETSHTYGTLYLLNPFLIDVCGTPWRLYRFEKLWCSLTGMDMPISDVEEESSLTVSDRLTINSLDGEKGRMNVNVIKK